MSGLAHATIPDSSDEVWIVGGPYGMVVALDLEGPGHFTTYPSDQPSVAIQIPFESVDDIPAHRVVAPGPCHFETGGSQIV